MKVEYVKTKKEYVMLLDIPSGTVFSPDNSVEIYIKLDKDGMSNIFTGDYEALDGETLGIQTTDDDWEEFDKLIAVAHLGKGALNFMHSDTIVKIVDCKLVAKEND